jgi:hypothetical protein
MQIEIIKKEELISMTPSRSLRTNPKKKKYEE